MRHLLVCLIIAILIAVPVQARHLTKNDFSVSVENLKEYYDQGESLSIKITISPVSTDVAKEMANRNYKFYNYLDPPRKMEITIAFKELGSIAWCTTDRIYTVTKENTSWDKGIDSIKVNMSGKVPSVSGGVEEYTAFELQIDDADPIKVNITIVNPPKIRDEINDIKGRLSKIENELKEFPSPHNLIDRLNGLKKDLNDLEVLYENGHYTDVVSRLDSLKKNVNSLEGDTKRAHAEYCVNTCRKILDDIDVNVTKVESLIDLLKGDVKTNYTLKLADVKAKKVSYEDDVNDLEKLYNDGNYDEVISRYDTVLKEGRSVLKEVNNLLSELRSPVTTTTTQLPKIEVDWKKVGLYGGALAGVVICGVLVVVALKRYMKRRRWDELK